MNPNFAKEGCAGALPGALRLKLICMKWRKLQLPSDLVWRHRQPQLRQSIAQWDLWIQTCHTSLFKMKVAIGNRVSLHESYLDTFTPTFQVQWPHFKSRWGLSLDHKWKWKLIPEDNHFQKKGLRIGLNPIQIHSWKRIQLNTFLKALKNSWIGASENPSYSFIVVTSGLHESLKMDTGCLHVCSE